ncbi:hypothetical protein ABT140_33195, partial [Streptomyces californicus]|uniref:hypothetical protein n=1 Tax=Streptomyces californicus TaxID=67351 RepID=UPI00331F73C9
MTTAAAPALREPGALGAREPPDVRNARSAGTHGARSRRTYGNAGAPGRTPAALLMITQGGALLVDQLLQELQDLRLDGHVECR